LSPSPSSPCSTSTCCPRSTTPRCSSSREYRQGACVVTGVNH
jgi:hypothetical protein